MRVADARRVAPGMAGVAAWLLPLGKCPACLAASAGFLSATGLGFALSPDFLLRASALLLAMAVVPLAVRSWRSRRWGATGLALAGALGIVASRLWLMSSAGAAIALFTMLCAWAWSWTDDRRMAALSVPSSQPREGTT